jgi:hypothetical protein
MVAGVQYEHRGVLLRREVFDEGFQKLYLCFCC